MGGGVGTEVSERLPAAFLCFLQAFSAGEGAEEGGGAEKQSWRLCIASAPLTVSESHGGGVDVSVGLASLHPAVPALDTGTP